MSDASSFTPVEEVFGKANRKTCDLKHFEDARVTGHAVELHLGYDVRDKH